MRSLWEIGVVVGVASLLYVMLHAEMWVSDDPPWLRPIRIIGFIVASGLVADSLVEQWEVPMPACLPFGAASSRSQLIRYLWFLRLQERERMSHLHWTPIELVTDVAVAAMVTSPAWMTAEGQLEEHLKIISLFLGCVWVALRILMVSSSAVSAWKRRRRKNPND